MYKRWKGSVCETWPRHSGGRRLTAKSAVVCVSWKVFDKRETVPVCECKSYETTGEFCFVCASHHIQNVKGGWFSSKKYLPLSASVFRLSARSPRKHTKLQSAHLSLVL